MTPEFVPFSFVPFIFAAVVILIIVLVIAGSIQQRKRREALAAWAAAHGWRFDPQRVHHLDGQYPEFDCLREGHSRYAYNCMSGEADGHGVLAFDYHYATNRHDSKGRSKTDHHYFSAIILRSRVRLEPLLIRPEGFFDKVSEFFGADDIDFESAEFSRKFFVKAPSKRWAYDVIHTRAMEFLLQNPRFTIEFGTRNAIIRSAGTFEVEKYAAAFQVLKGLIDLFPEYLVRHKLEAERI